MAQDRSSRGQDEWGGGKPKRSSSLLCRNKGELQCRRVQRGTNRKPPLLSAHVGGPKKLGSGRSRCGPGPLCIRQLSQGGLGGFKISTSEASGSTASQNKAFSRTVCPGQGPPNGHFNVDFNSQSSPASLAGVEVHKK